MLSTSLLRLYFLARSIDALVAYMLAIAWFIYNFRVDYKVDWKIAANDKSKNGKLLIISSSSLS